MMHGFSIRCSGHARATAAMGLFVRVPCTYSIMAYGHPNAGDRRRLTTTFDDVLPSFQNNMTLDIRMDWAPGYHAWD